MANGYVKGLVAVVENTARGTGFNILLMGDGFTETQQQSFDNACEVFRQTLFKAQPFNQLANQINIYKLNVVSIDSGAGDGAHPNRPLPRNYFGSWFDPGSDRLLVCAQDIAQDTAGQWLPNHKAAIVVTNTSRYGGSGGQVAVYSLAPFAELIALHEMGHSAFGLADECR